MSIQPPTPDNFNWEFPIQTISRADLCDENLPRPLTKEQVMFLDDADMVYLAKKLRGAYMDSGIYWSSLADGVEDILAQRQSHRQESEDGEEQEFMVRWIMTGKFEATYKVKARSQEEANAYVAEHRLKLEPVEVLPLSDDYEQFL